MQRRKTGLIICQPSTAGVTLRETPADELFFPRLSHQKMDCCYELLQLSSVTSEIRRAGGNPNNLRTDFRDGYSRTLEKIQSFQWLHHRFQLSEAERCCGRV